MRFGAFGALALAALAAACGTSFGESADDADDAGANRANAGDASTSDVSAPATTRDAGDASENQGDDADTISDAAAPVDGQTIIGISASLYFGCALRANGTTSCWGDNSSGELGIGSTSAPTTTPQLVHFPAKPLRVSGTTATGCALLEDGTVACWGSNQYGQLDLALDAATSSATPIRIASDAGVLQNAKEVVAGFALACARIATDASADTETVCWGTDVNGDTGQTGLPNGTVQTILPVNGLGPSEQTSVLLGTSCALTGGSVKCWGANMSPTLIALADGGPLDGVVQLGVGFGYACVRTGAGAVLCWGQNNFGQLGIGNQIASEQPSVPAIASGAVELSVGYQHACAILDGGALQCWGSDVFHESGVVMTDPPSCDAGACVPRPATKSLPTAARLVSASQGQTLVVGQDNNVYGWGLDNYDQLGAPTSTTCAVGSNSVSCSFDPLLVNGIY